MVHPFDFGGQIVPWGRDAEEYEAFFDLREVDSSARVLDCGGGPASFGAQWGRRGRFVVVADPAFATHPLEIAAGFDATADRMLKGMEEAHDRFDWDQYGDPEGIIVRRRAALGMFLQDRMLPRPAARYVTGGLPDLPFRSRSFDLALCSHLLFLYSSELSFEEHVESLRELLRVAQEVRVFPLLDMRGEESNHLVPCMDALRETARLEVLPVSFEFRNGDSRMLRLTRRE